MKCDDAQSTVVTVSGKGAVHSASRNRDLPKKVKVNGFLRLTLFWQSKMTGRNTLLSERKEWDFGYWKVTLCGELKIWEIWCWQTLKGELAWGRISSKEVDEAENKYLTHEFRLCPLSNREVVKGFKWLFIFKYMLRKK